MISVIIPIYNNIRYLKDCLDSVLAQTYLESSPFGLELMVERRERGSPASRQDSVEIIMVDDGSDEPIAGEIKSIVSSLSEREAGRDLVSANFSINPPQPSFLKGGGLKVIRIPHTGAAASRNRGFAESHGELVFFCDADVILRADCLRVMADALKAHPEAAYAYSDYNLGCKKMPGMPFDAEALKKINYISTMSLIRRQDFSGFDESLKRFQDWDLWLTLLERGKIGIYIPEALFCAHPAKFGMSKWRPSFIYKWLPWLPSVKEYKNAREIVLKKHNII